MPRKEDERHRRFASRRQRSAADGDPSPTIPLRPELAEVLKDKEYACVPETTNLGTVFIIKAPAREIESARGRVPIHFRHELYQHPASPVVRTVIRIYDQPHAPLALESFINVGDEQQRAEYASLGEQDRTYLIFYDEQLRHRLNKAVPLTRDGTIGQVVRTADTLLAAIPEAQRDFDRAKADVMRVTQL